MQNYKRYYDRGLPFLWVFIDPKAEAQTDLITKVITPVAKTARDKLSFIKMDGIKWGDHGKSLGLKGDTPAIVIEDREKGRNYVFGDDKPINDANFAQYVNDYVAGKLVAKLKSEEPPATQTGPVTVVVGKTWQDIVLQDDKDVLIEFYAPWCGHCKTLEPQYNDLGKQFSSDSSVVISKIDATANDTPIIIKGFPSIYFFPAGDKEHPIEYTGDRTAKGLADFVQKNRKTKPGKAEL